VRLALIHRTPGSAPAPADSTAWRTCLREIHFLPSHRVPLETGVLTDAEAYALLLEVVCGLRSPLIGETEVQAQFKQFLASTAAGDRSLGRLGQRVLGDAKRIRHKHLQGFGAHSYGRLAARYLVGRRVAVIGTGALAAEVVRSTPETVRVDLWGRSSERVLPTRPAGLTFSLISDAANRKGVCEEPATVVVAAPIGHEDLSHVLSQYQHLVNAIDLRSLDQQTVISCASRVVLLADLLSEAAQTDLGGGPKLLEAHADIRELALAFAGRDNIRPFGWDDVCA
jgi:glutamyl-tRNA reductase